MDNQLIQNNRISFQEEQDQLLQMVLHERFFYPWGVSGYDTPEGAMPKGSLEVFVTSVCNQKCEYCYLQRFPNLYPVPQNPELLKKNLRALLDYVCDNRWYLPNLDLFGGETWHTPFGLELLDIVYEYVTQRGMPLPSITIPTNASFCLYPKQMAEMQNRIDRFRECGTDLKISISIDGKVVEDIERPIIDSSMPPRDDAFYDRVFAFAKHNGYGFHPMLAAKSAKYWIENYKWWVSMLRKFDMSLDSLMLLEVRNGDWEEEDIAEYEKFVRYLTEETYRYHDGDFLQFMNDMLLINQLYDSHDLLWGDNTSYMPHIFGDGSKGLYGCTIQTHMTVRLGDLAIAPCHRTAYDKYVYGHFTQDDNGKITGLRANNPQMAINILMLDSRYSVLGCDSCKFQPICLGTCKGQSIESQQDPFHNDPKVCNFLRKKYTLMFKVLEEYGTITWLKENMTKYHSDYESYQKFLQVWDKIVEEEKYERLGEFRQNIFS